MTARMSPPDIRPGTPNTAEVVAAVLDDARGASGSVGRAAATNGWRSRRRRGDRMTPQTDGTNATATRLAVSKAEAASVLGISADFFERHVMHELRIVRPRTPTAHPDNRAAALARRHSRSDPA